MVDILVSAGNTRVNKIRGREIAAFICGAYSLTGAEDNKQCINYTIF